jgi:DNA (cytosine-5)-methyltransferase 1
MGMRTENVGLRTPKRGRKSLRMCSECATSPWGARMTEAPLVLSLFPGIGLLDMAFEQEGFCVVRGPDLLWGGDIRNFHPPAAKFDGVIGGPPCQLYSGLANFAHRWKFAPEHLIPEYGRVVGEAAPAWFVMENGRNAPLPAVAGYVVRDCLLNNRSLGEEQNRVRRFSLGSQHGAFLWIEPVAVENDRWAAAVTASQGGERRVHGKKSTGGKIARYTVAEALRLQGLPSDFFESGAIARKPYLTAAGRLKVIAEGVPLPMGRAIAKAVKRAMYPQLEASA